MTPGITVNSIASGSSGNSMLIRTPKTAILIDAGISAKRIKESLLQLGQAPADIKAIFITHEHSDHTQGALVFAKRFSVPLISSAGTLAAVIGDRTDIPHEPLTTEEGLSMEDIRLEAFPIPHDAVNPFGFCVYSGRHKICFATDIGVATQELRQHIRDADLLILESNHDAEMLRRGPYPQFLKNRIAGNRGHLCNDAAAELLVERAANPKPGTAWLAHLSQTNNNPGIALRCAQGKLALSGGRLNVEVALRDRPSSCWNAEQTSFQLSMGL
jgi:phosphoribosyl 1,2-cyclic phosphodiesterase